MIARIKRSVRADLVKTLVDDGMGLDEVANVLGGHDDNVKCFQALKLGPTIFREFRNSHLRDIHLDCLWRAWNNWHETGIEEGFWECVEEAFSPTEQDQIMKDYALQPGSWEEFVHSHDLARYLLGKSNSPLDRKVTVTVKRRTAGPDLISITSELSDDA